jgi:hypothetical protein
MCLCLCLIYHKRTPRRAAPVCVDIANRVIMLATVVAAVVLPFVGG